MLKNYAGRIGAAVGVIGAVGCMAPSETSPRLGGVAALPAIEDAPDPAPPLSDEPSLTSIDRSGWDEKPVLAPVDNRYLFPGVSLRPDYSEALARQRGDYPTVDSAVELSGPESAAHAEMWAGPIWAAWDLVLLPRVFFGYVPTRHGRPLDWRDRAIEEGIDQPLEPAPLLGPDRP